MEQCVCDILESIKAKPIALYRTEFFPYDNGEG